MSNEQKNKIDKMSAYISEDINEKQIQKSIIQKLITEANKYDREFVDRMYEYYDGMKQYNNYLTEDEASQILSNFVNYDGTKGAMFKNSMWLFNRLTEQNLHCECAPNYNKWALYVTMNKFASDQGNVINKWIGEDKDKFIIACYDLSTAQLSDADRLHWVRSYFNL